MEHLETGPSPVPVIAVSATTAIICPVKLPAVRRGTVGRAVCGTVPSARGVASPGTGESHGLLLPSIPTSLTRAAVAGTAPMALAIVNGVPVEPDDTVGLVAVPHPRA